MKNLIKDFKKQSEVEDRIIKKYQDRVPKEISEFWKEYGFGTFFDGYLKSVNPENFEEILRLGSQRFQDGIVLFATGMGDLIIWSDNYVRVLNFRYGIIDTVMSGFTFFFEDVSDIDFRVEELKWSPYPQATELLGAIEYNECFGYLPILGIGGAEKVENLEKVQLIEHLQLIIEFMGPIV
ncbi:T6SS immunity protein Tdi1 domain-containing protein [Listeria seeligeri]|uniref:T6SS immunity protein Tdi1 domain-containing protein n=1 Tax=Listeria seeligeri TaxID=1640 RepID=UPI001629AA18|nr:T6SS immunity protein Tdi1 domain-containing protein [Listeria seeligeri]MBC1722148.1 DUF1851 domain-containing protein [Listeria seeligeri]MBC1859274.1 DUF1851 domain-containing protein [Listeria seeligeri]MBF2654483.1 DUF1851 domain-containing protein [Listeria seeligeri]